MKHMEYFSATYMYFPCSHVRCNVSHIFAGLPGVIGAVDGTHIQILKPTRCPETYFNRKKFYSLNVMLVCDSNEHFTYYSVGSPGSFHDARVFRRSKLEERVDNLPEDRHILGECFMYVESCS